jgi:cardiolipin synthase
MPATLTNLRTPKGIELHDSLGDILRLIVQPGDGTAPLIKAIKAAKKSIEIVIFRLDQKDIERALEDAAGRGVAVTALITYTNRGGENSLRKLEMRFLAKGITVARTANDLVRYHGKMMLIDRKELFVLTYNFTHLDIERSRSFGIVTKNAELVRAAVALFDADSKRTAYKAKSRKFLVSPVNARQELAAFLKGAKKELLIYDIKLTDPTMSKIIAERIAAGVQVRILGGAVSDKKLPSRKLRRYRLHTRGILRDGKHLFLGSQSMRKLELDARREIGAIVQGPKVVSGFSAVFDDDWRASETEKDKKEAVQQVNGEIKRVAKKAAEKVQMEPVVKEVVAALRKEADVEVSASEVKKHLKTAVKTALKKAVKKAAAEIVEKAS